MGVSYRQRTTWAVAVLLAALGVLWGGCGGSGDFSAGGGSGVPPPSGSDDSATSGEVTPAETQFEVNATTGEVKVKPLAGTQVQTQAILGGDALTYDSSRLLDQAGSPGRRVLQVKLTNRSGETLGRLTTRSGETLGGVSQGIRVLFSPIQTNADITPIAARVTVSTAVQYPSSPSPTFVNDVAVAPDGALVATGFNGAIGFVDRAVWAGGAPTSPSSHRRATISPAGTFSSIPSGLVVSPNGVIYALDETRLIRIVFRGGDPTLSASYRADVIAGATTPGTADGNGFVARFQGLRGVAFDSTGALVVADGDRLRRVSLVGADPDNDLDWNVAVVAGTTLSGFVDGGGASARFSQPTAAADPTVPDAWFAADSLNRAVRRIVYDGSGSRDDPANYAVTTVAGDSAIAGHQDGSGEEARFGSLQGITVDQGGAVYATAQTRLYRIRYTGSGDRGERTSYLVDTLVNGSGGPDGAGNVASLTDPRGLAVGPDGVLYVADEGNLRIARVTLPPPDVTDGNQPPGTTGTPGAVRLVDASGQMPNNVPYIAYPPLDDGSSASQDWTFDIAPGVHTFRFTVRALAPTEHPSYPQAFEGEVITLAGIGTAGFRDGPARAAAFSAPRYVAVDEAGALYVTDTNNHAVRRIGPDDTVTTITGGTEGFANGIGLAGRLRSPAGIAYAGDGVLLIADNGNNAIRRLELQTPAGSLLDGLARADASDPANWRLSTIAGTNTPSFADGPGQLARFNGPWGIASLDGRTVLVTDRANHRVRLLTFHGGDPNAAASWRVETLAGSGAPGTANGTGAAASFNQPTAVALGQDLSLYVVDIGTNRLRKVSQIGVVSTLLSAGLNQPTGLAVDNADTLYISSFGARVIQRLRPGGSLEALAGTGTAGGADGPAPSARFERPLGLGLGPDGTLYIVDQGRSTVRALQRSIVNQGPSG